MDTQTEKNLTRSTSKNTDLEGFVNPYGFDDLTLYKTADFEVIQKKNKIFQGYLMGRKTTSKRNIPMFYFLTTEGEEMKTFGNGNLTASLDRILEDGYVKSLVAIEYLGKQELDIEIDGNLTPTMVNQWKVLFNKNKKTAHELDAALNLEIGPVN